MQNSQPPRDLCYGNDIKVIQIVNRRADWRVKGGIPFACPHLRGHSKPRAVMVLLRLQFLPERTVPQSAILCCGVVHWVAYAKCLAAVVRSDIRGGYAGIAGWNLFYYQRR